MEVIVVLLIIALIIAVVLVPIQIAKHRGVSGGELTTVKILSWCGLIFSITWVIALILSLTYKPENWVDKQNLPQSTNNNLEDLEKLSSLKDKGIISEDEFNKEKQKLLKNI